MLNTGNNKAPLVSQAFGFNFAYDRPTFRQFKISPNGFLAFDGNQTSALPTNTLNSNVLIFAPLWDDLSVDAAGKVHYQLSGSAPNRVSAVVLKNVQEKNSPSLRSLFGDVCDGGIGNLMRGAVRFPTTAFEKKRQVWE